MKQKGITITRWSIVIFMIAGLIMILFGIRVREASLLVGQQIQIEENRRVCEMESQAMADGSDYLTSEVWRFVATRDITHMENYWMEVRHSRSRDTAIEHLKKLSLTGEELRLVESAKQTSDELIKKEAWAMRLVADSLGMTPEELPDEVAAVVYKDGEEALSPEEKTALASQYIFGAQYTAKKEIIKGNINSFRRILRDRKNKELEDAVSRTDGALRMIRLLMSALIFFFILQAVIFYFFIIRPFYYYARSLQQMDGKEFSELRPMGARETRAFADTFNRIYTEWQTQKQSLEKERYRFHVALENTSVIVYEYDASSDTYTACGSLENDILPSAGLQPERIIEHFLKQHVTEFMGKSGLDYFNGILTQLSPAQTELKLQRTEDVSGPVWVRITGTPVTDEDTQTVRVIGKITNIQSEKEKEFALEDARSRDGLTGLYKREVGIRKARDYMKKKSPGEICGIMLMDMDDFSRINELEGGSFADAVLQDVADIVRSMTGPDDILVRLGGDEFMLFIKNCPKSRATVLGPQIAARIRELSGHPDTRLQISASIGMCVTEVVDEYNGLYRCAESTLKYTKEHKKGHAACYLDTSNELGMLLTQMYPGRHTISKIENAEGSGEDLLSFALDLLGKSKNLDDAVFLLLSRVGNSCRLDRVQIVEFDGEYLSCRCVYQWCRNLSDRLSGETLYITREDMQSITGSYDEEGMSEKRILTKQNGMKSILHSAIFNYGQCAGAMCFELHRFHIWTVEERQLLSELTKIISSFTLKAQADAVSRAKTDFLSRMSHEIRTPMNAITGMTIIAKTVPGNPSKTLDCLNKIDSANKYLLTLINDVLDMSRIESGKVEIHRSPMRLTGLIDNLETLVRPQTDEKQLHFEISNGFTQRTPLMADELRLNQVLVNLLGNAVKFTDRGGTVCLRIEPAETTKQNVLLRFNVSDTGIGISQEAQSRIFNAFEQASSDTAANYGGTGLGLTISSRLVQLMGGSLEVTSEPGKGSSFYFSLRLDFAPDEVMQEPVSVGEVSFDPLGKRLLLVEDNALNREIAREILEMHGFTLETATNGREALDKFSENEPGYYDAILMDIRMPVMDGIEAARFIRTMGKPDSRTIVIVAMTANAFDEDMKKSLENGMDVHLSKPIDVEELLKTLGRLLSPGRKADL